jgi:hypothetical protein
LPYPRKDQAFWGQLHNIILGLQDGQIDPEHVVSAYQQSRKPGIKNRGAKFWAAIQFLSGLNGSDIAAIGRAG